jgi:hypothetical protein
MRAELDLVLRVLEPQDGLAGLLGDRVVEEHRIASVARFDPFAGGYRIERRGLSSRAAGSAGLVVEDIEEAVTALLTVGGIRLPLAAGAESTGEPERYVAARAVLHPLRLSRRLRLIALAIRQYSLRSGWTRLPAVEVTP